MRVMTKLLLSIDTEASGPCPMMGDVISFGAVVIEPGLKRVYRSFNMRPTVDAYNEGAYKSIGLTRAEHEAYPHTVEEGFKDFVEWLDGLDATRLIMVSDNPAFDYQWMNFGLWHAVGRNPLGHSARRIGDMWSGIKNSEHRTSDWKRLRQTRHTHDPLDDAKGNAEAYLQIWGRG